MVWNWDKKNSSSDFNFVYKYYTIFDLIHQIFHERFIYWTHFDLLSYWHANARGYKILNYKSNLEGLAAPEAP